MHDEDDGFRVDLAMCDEPLLKNAASTRGERRGEGREKSLFHRVHVPLKLCRFCSLVYFTVNNKDSSFQFGVDRARGLAGEGIKTVIITTGPK